MFSEERAMKMHWARLQVDPEDEYSDMIPSYCEEDLHEYREAKISAADGEMGVLIKQYTCDTCAKRFVCPLVFDSDSTNGSCAMKNQK